MCYQIKDGKCEKQIVEDPVNLLSREGPHGDAISQNADVAGQKYEEAFEDPFKNVLRWQVAFLDTWDQYFKTIFAVIEQL